MKYYIVSILAAILFLSPCKGFCETPSQEQITEWRRAAEQGDAPAQYKLGVIYAHGHGVIQDYAEALKWYRLAAEQGNNFAQYNLAGAYYKGEGVVRSLPHLL